MTSEPQKTNQDLTQLALSGFSWQFFNRMSSQAVQFGISVVLARLLLPADYGLVGMAAVFIGFSRMVSELGFGGAIVQKKDLTDDLLSSVFWTNLLTGLILWMIAWLAAPWVADFYETPAVAPILVASSFSLVLASPAAVPRALLYKSMQFKHMFALNWAGIVLGGMVSILAALQGLGVWSLVLGNLVTPLTVTIFAWRFCTWRPKLVFTFNKLKDISQFSGYYLGFQVFRYLSGSLDYLIIGKFFTPTELGWYTLAFRLIDLPRIHLGAIVRSVMYPVFVAIQGDNKRTQVGLQKTYLAVSLLVFPALIGLAVIAPDFITLFYGAKWYPSAGLLQILVLAGMASAIELAPAILFARGKANWVFWVNVGKAVLLLVLLLIGVSWNLTVVAAIVSIYTLVTVIFLQVWTNRLVGLSIRNFIRSLTPALIISLIMALAVWSAKATLPTQLLSPWGILILQVTVGVVVYAIGVLLWPGNEMKGLKNLFLIQMFRITRFPLFNRRVQ